MMAFGALFEAIGVAAVPAFVSFISMPDRMLEFGAVRWAYDRLGLEAPQQMVVWAALALVLIFVLKNLYLTFLAYVRERYAAARQVTISNRLFRAYLHSSYTFHLQRNSAELLRNTYSEAEDITDGVILPCLWIAMEGMVILFVCVLLFSLEPLASLIVLGGLGLVTIAFLRATQHRIRAYASQEQHHRTESFRAVNQGLGGFKDTRILGREQFFIRAFQESSWIKARAERFRDVISAMPRLFLETLVVAGMLGITIVLIAQGRGLETILPTLTLLGVALIRLMPSYTSIAQEMNHLAWGQAALNIVYTDLRDLEEQEERLIASRAGEQDDPLAFEQEIRLERVSYRYHGAETDAVHRVSLTIPHHSSVGFVGPSGAGKTTIVDVILGFLPPTEGRVLVDGVNAHSRLPSWQRKIGYIPQQVYLTDDTVRSNVAFGLGPGEIDDAAVWEALEAAQLAAFVKSLPNGLDTIVGELGVRLSGGQRQRIGIARALYHRPGVLVMDEATSAVDNLTEQQIVASLKRLQGDHTMLIIAHRLSTVRHCDTLFFLDDGELVAHGSYEDLLQTCDRFREMVGEEALEAEAV